MIRKEDIANAELTANEKRVLLALEEESGEWTKKTLSEKTGINEDTVMQAAFMLAQKELCEIRGERKVYHHLTEEGKKYAEKGLPERRGLDLLPLPCKSLRIRSRMKRNRTFQQIGY